MADVQLDTVDALMARYAAGILPEPARVLVEAHLEMQSLNRPKVTEYETVVGDILEKMEPVALNSRDAALKAVFAADPLAAPTNAPLRPAMRFFQKPSVTLPGWKPTKSPGK